MTNNYDQADAILANMADDQMLTKAQAHATLAVADALGRLVEALGSARDVGAERIVVTGHSDAMAMVDQEIDRMRTMAPRHSDGFTEWQAGWRSALAELRRRLHEVDGPPGRLVNVAPALTREQLEELGAQLVATYTALRRFWVAMPEPDPLAHVKVGDENPTTGEGPICGQGHHGYGCTRRPHPTPWQHIAADADDCVVAVWGGAQ